MVRDIPRESERTLFDYSKSSRDTNWRDSVSLSFPFQPNVTNTVAAARERERERERERMLERTARKKAFTHEGRRKGDFDGAASTVASSFFHRGSRSLKKRGRGRKEGSREKIAAREENREQMYRSRSTLPSTVKLVADRVTIPHNYTQYSAHLCRLCTRMCRRTHTHTHTHSLTQQTQVRDHLREPTLHIHIYI